MGAFGPTRVLYLDQILILNEKHLGRVLKEYVDYHNSFRLYIPGPVIINEVGWCFNARDSYYCPYAVYRSNHLLILGCGLAGVR